MRWRQEQLDAVGTSIARAREGHPWLLAVEGEPGMGKSALLREVARRATGFHVLSGEGNERARLDPFELLRQWGIVADARAEASTNPFQLAQALRERVDSLAYTGPVLILLDDLQWIDQESVEAIVWLLRRASGDRLLVAAAFRPLRAPAQPLWRRLLLDRDDLTAIELDGLNLEQATELVQAAASGASVQLAQRLLEHTGGNPLYLRSLLNEHEVAELERMDRLPAPLDLVHSLDERLDTLSPQSAELLRSIAVLGTQWVDLPLAAELAQIPDAGPAADVLTTVGLAERRSTAADAPLRISQALIRAAVYEEIPAARRRELHTRAAELLTLPSSRLEHRVSASTQYDAELAAELDTYAEELHDTRAYRQASRFKRLSSNLTADPVTRERRWLDGVFEAAMAKDVDDVRNELPAVSHAKDVARSTLIQGALLMVEKRWVESLHTLESLPAAVLADTDPRTRMRIGVLLGWVRVATGAAPETVMAGLATATAEGATDQGMRGYLTFARGQAALQLSDPQTLEQFWSELPTRVADVPPTESFRLAWRGSVFALAGVVDEAVRDLEEFTRRISGGEVDIGDGVFNALLGFALWMRGDWRRARVAIGVAGDSRFGVGHPLVMAILPLPLIDSGEVDRAGEAIRAAQDLLHRAPWPAAVQCLTMVKVIRMHAYGSPSEQRGLYADIRRELGGSAPRMPGNVPPLWFLHMGLAAVWASDIEEVEYFADRLSHVPLDPTWSSGAVAWLRGLGAERRGELAEADRRLGVADAAGIHELPLYQAHLTADRARIAGLLGRAESQHSLAQSALEQYARLGARSYVERMTTLLDGPTGDSGVDDVLAQLTDRERDVVALLVEGMSYAQIARELYVTRSTVAFHLSNVYAKTNTESRHALVDLVRSASLSVGGR